ncbi:MAG: MFS transporter, partial [Gammaproteobacteria bacterium]|nr:MFS transporter [Gammaproteobacteria bacterium]
ILIVAVCFALASLPTFLFLKERGNFNQKPQNISYFSIGFKRLKSTWQHAHLYQDLFRFLIAMTVYYCGINTVVVLAAIYAQQAMGFETEDTIKLILVVNITAAFGAFVFGFIQDKLGSIKTLTITLLIWISATLLAYFTETVTMFWIVANMVGLALGASQSAGRALVGLLSPMERNGEFFGLWGLATKLAAIIGPMVYGLITFLTRGDHRLALLSTIVFFVVGLLILLTVNEQRGREAAKV